MAELIAPKPASASDKKSAEGPKLEIVGGLHSGVALHLAQGVYRIGSTAEADIVLRDPGVAKEHGVLRIERSEVRIEAVGGDIAIEGRAALASGHGSRVALPLEISLGQARLRVSDPRREAGRRRFPMAGALIAAGGLGACVFAASVVAGGLQTSLRLDADAPQVSGGADATGTIAKPVALETAPTPAADLAARLETAGLRSLKLTVAGDRISVAGTVPRQDADAWTSIQQWYDKTHARVTTLVSNVVVGEARTMPGLALQAIWFGDRPYLITSDGAKYYEGAFLDNGWTVRTIQEDRVILVKGDESFALTY